MAWTKKVATRQGEARYKVYWYDPAGIQRSKTFKKAEDARRFERSVEVDKDRGSYVDPARGRKTFSEFWPEFMAASELRPSTRDLYERCWRLYLAEPFGHRSLASVSPSDVRCWLISLKERGIGSATQRASVQLLKVMLNRAVDDELIVRNPARKVETPNAGTREMRFLSAEEVERLAESVSDRYRALIYLLAYGGLRIGEAAALTVDKLDLLRGKATVDVSVSEVAGTLAFGPTKTGRIRTVDLPPFLREELAHHIERYVEKREAYVFSSPEGGPLRPNNFRKRDFDRALAKAGLPQGLRVHDLRHTCAALLIEQGAHAKVIADRLGHSSPTVTMKVYAHILPSLGERVTTGLEETFRRARQAGG